MGRNLEIEGLVEPCPPTPIPLTSHCGSRSSIIIIISSSQFHWLGLLAQHEIPSSLRSDCVPWTQSCNRIRIERKKKIRANSN